MSNRYVGEMDRKTAENKVNSMKEDIPYILRYTPNAQGLVVSIKFPGEPVMHVETNSVVGVLDLKETDKIKSAAEALTSIIDEKLSKKLQKGETLQGYLTSKETAEIFKKTEFASKYLSSEQVAQTFGPKSK